MSKFSRQKWKLVCWQELSGCPGALFQNSIQPGFQLVGQLPSHSSKRGLAWDATWLEQRQNHWFSKSVHLAILGACLGCHLVGTAAESLIFQVCSPSWKKASVHSTVIGWSALNGNLQTGICGNMACNAVKTTVKAWVSWSFSARSEGRKCALAYKGLKRATPTWPKDVVWRKTNLPANVWASSGVRRFVSKIIWMLFKRRWTRWGQGWSEAHTWSAAISTPNIFCTEAGGWAFLGLVCKPKTWNKEAKDSKPDCANSEGSVAPKSSTKWKHGHHNNLRASVVRVSAQRLKLQTEATAPKLIALCRNNATPSGRRMKV